jgi:hypothetical protein
LVREKKKKILPPNSGRYNECRFASLGKRIKRCVCLPFSIPP